LRKNLLPARRFPPPWTVEELEACFVVRDQDGQQLALGLFRPTSPRATHPNWIPARALSVCRMYRRASLRFVYPKLAAAQ